MLVDPEFNWLELARYVPTLLEFVTTSPLKPRVSEPTRPDATDTIELFSVALLS